MTGVRRELVIQKLRDVEPDQRVASPGRGTIDVFRVVEDPGVVPASDVTPGREPGVEAFGIGGIQKLEQPRQPARRELERERPSQRLIQIRLLAHA